jgi:phosphoglycolate phosphatase-like HAD superfamily hydrolase
MASDERERPLSQDRIALFDLDGSLADYDLAMRRDLRAMRAPCEPDIADEQDLHALEDQPHLDARMQFIKSHPGWWRTLPRIEAGFTIVRLAQELGFAINVLTKAPSGHASAWTEKFEWCRAQPELLDADVHLTMNKGLVYGTLLFDDFPRYMDDWLAHRPRGLGIMPVTAYNAHYAHPNVVKWNGANLAQVKDAMQRAFGRAPRKDLILG